MKIAVTGYKGRLGSELVNNFGCIPLECDITNVNQIREAIKSVYPDVIINCAAKTYVDGCVGEGFDEALAVNFRGAVKIRDNFNGYFIHISTDYVFDCKDGPYPEEYDDLYNSLNDYGWSKFGAEAGLLSSFSSNDRTMIVRTTGLYGSSHGKPDFVTKLVASLRRGEEIKVTNELHGNHTYIPHLAVALIKLCGFRNPVAFQEVIHIASRDVLTRYEFALMVAGVFELDKSLIIPCKNKDITEWIAKRPTKGGLKIKKADKYGIPTWDTLSGLKALKEKGIL